MVDRQTLPEETFLDGSYRIVRVIGAGGFGITYEAVDIKLATRVAIKEYFPLEFGDRDSSQTVRPRSQASSQLFEWGRDNFLTEARTLASFDHPSIVRVLRVFEANATAYMVMRFEKGLSFEEWLKSLGRLPTQLELDAIARPLLDALDHLHAVEYLHRDIAPDNIVIRPDGTPVLLDFGSARHVVAEKTRAVTGIVKAGYSPQEQYASDNKHQGPWTDIYSFGGTLYRAVAGRKPPEAMLRFDAASYEPAAEIARGRYRVPFLAAIDRALSVKPADRPQSVADLREQLFRIEDPTPTVILPREEPAAVAVAAPADPAKPAGLFANPKVQKGALAALIGLGALSGLQIAYHLDLLPALTARPSVTTSTPADDAGARAAAKRLAEAERVQKEEEAKAQAEAERKRVADLEAERQRIDAEAKKAAAAEAARRQAEAEGKRLAALEAERKRIDAEKAKAAEAEAVRLKADAEKKRLADLEAERLRFEAEKKKVAEAEAERLKAEAEQKRVADLEAERLKRDAIVPPASRQDGGRQGIADPRIGGRGADGDVEEFLASYRELLHSQNCAVANLTSSQLEKSVPAYIEAVNKHHNAQLEKIDFNAASRSIFNSWLEKAHSRKSATCPFDPVGVTPPPPPPPRPVVQPVQKAPVYRPAPTAQPRAAPQAPSQRTIMGIQ